MGDEGDRLGGTEPRETASAGQTGLRAGAGVSVTDGVPAVCASTADEAASAKQSATSVL